MSGIYSNAMTRPLLSNGNKMITEGGGVFCAKVKSQVKVMLLTVSRNITLTQVHHSHHSSHEEHYAATYKYSHIVTLVYCSQAQ
jgi:hypothetical protein